MIRAAAKNHRYVAVVVRPESYDAVLAELEEADGEISPGHAALARQRGVRVHRPLRRRDQRAGSASATRTSRRTGRSRWRSSSTSPTARTRTSAARSTPRSARAATSSAGSPKEHGKELSFNNVLDLDSARSLLADLDGPACVIVKHNNPCGAAEGESALDAYEKALACDPLSAYGGVIALNRPIDEELARAAARELRRGPDRARLRGRGDGDPPAEAGDPDPRGHRAARCTAPSSTSSGSAAGCSSRSPTRSPTTARG